MFTSRKYAGFSKPDLFCDKATLPTSDPTEQGGITPAGEEKRREYDYIIAGGTSLCLFPLLSRSRRVVKEGQIKGEIPT